MDREDEGLVIPGINSNTAYENDPEVMKPTCRLNAPGSVARCSCVSSMHDVVLASRPRHGRCVNSSIPSCFAAA